MRFRDFVATVIIATCTSLLVVWALIGAGIIQTPQQIPQQQPQIIKQTHTGTLTSTLNQTGTGYEAYIEKIPIQNVTDKTAARILHVYFEANVTDYPNSEVEINSLQLRDQQTQNVVTERYFRFELTNQSFLTIDTSIDPTRSFYISVEIVGKYNFTLAYNLVIIQEIFA